MSIHIVYETHSTTEDNEAGIATGWLPGDLSAAGREQAALLGKRRRDNVDVVFSSDLRRAIQTVEIAFRHTPVRIRQDSRLRECDYGELNGAPVTELLPRVKHIDRPFPGGQSYRDVVELTRDFLRELSRNHVGHRILLVAHSANRWALQHLLEGARLEDLVDAPFQWQEGWHYQLPARWTG